MNSVYPLVRKFKDKYPLTVAWRIKKHSKLIDSYLNPNEEVLYAFVAQKNTNWWDFVNTNVVALTNERILVGTKRLIFGCFYVSITPKLYNDLSIKEGLIWGQIWIDTVKEVVKLSNIQKSALPEIETTITEYMLRAKRKMKENETGI